MSISYRLEHFKLSTSELLEIYCYFIAYMSHYEKFTTLHKLFSIAHNLRIKSSKNFPRNHAVPELFFLIALGTRLARFTKYFSQHLIMLQTYVIISNILR